MVEEASDVLDEVDDEGVTVEEASEALDLVDDRGETVARGRIRRTPVCGTASFTFLTVFRIRRAS